MCERQWPISYSIHLQEKPVKCYRCFILISFFLFTSLAGNVLAQDVSQQTPRINWRSYYHDDAARPFLRGLTWSPNSDYVAAADQSLKTLSIFGIEEERIVRTIELPDWPQRSNLWFSVRWSPNGDFLALALWGSAYVIDAQTGVVISKLESASADDVASSSIIDVHWANDSNRVAAFSLMGFISVFDAITSEISLRIDLNEGDYPIPVYDLFDWSPDNSRFAAYVYRSDAIGVWDSEGNLITDGTREPTLRPNEGSCHVGARTSLRVVDGIACANDNVTLLTSGFGISLCRFEDNLLVATDNHIFYQSEVSEGEMPIVYGVSSASWSPDGQWVVGTMGAGVSDPTAEFYCHLRFFHVTDSITVSRIDKGMCPFTQWNSNGRYIAGIDGGLWVGEVLQG